MEFFHSHIDERAIAEVVRVLGAGFVSEGKEVAAFEDLLSCTLAVDNPVTVNSGTAALHLALVIAGVKAGDEVIVPAQTFIATAHVVLMCGATPVFADINPSDGNLSAESLLKSITARTKAVIPVHWGGYPCDMDAINSIAADAGIAVVEDAAHALGACYKGRPVGTLSRFTCFSFQAIKHLTTGDGGAIGCKFQNDARTARTLRWFGIDRTETSPNILGERDYDLTQLGFKYHMNNVAAALGIGNLANFSSRLARHREIAERYRSGLAELEGLRLPDYADDRQSSWWFFPLLVERRDDFVQAMHDRAIPCSVVHRRIDRNSIYSSHRRSLPGQNEFDRLQINLPVHVALSDDDIQRTISGVREGW